jgi:hypothetical protein
MTQKPESQAGIIPTVLPYLKLFAEWIKSPRTLSIFGAVAALALFLPACWLATVHVYSGIDHYRAFLWLVFSLCVVGLVFDAGNAIFVRCKLKKRLHYLARDEQEVLADFVLNDVSSSRFAPTQAGATSSLAAAGILHVYSAKEPMNVDARFVYYTIEPWILRYLHKHMDCLGGFSSRPTIPDEEGP